MRLLCLWLRNVRDLQIRSEVFQFHFEVKNFSFKHVKSKAMKRKISFLLSLLCIISSVTTFGQNQKQKSMEEIICTPPKFTGIKATIPMLLDGKFPTIENYLTENANYPGVAKQLFSQGTVVVHFVITPKGEVSDIKIVNSVSKEIDEEVIGALMTTSGMWKPGNNNGDAVAMEKEVSVIFRLEDSKYSFNDMVKTYFSHGAEMLFMKKSPKKALRYFDKGITLLPNETSLLALRGMTRFELGDKEGALRDWTRIKNLGGLEGVGYIDCFIDMKGYAEMNRVLGK